LGELAWRYNQAAEGFPWDPARATALLEKMAVGYRQGRYGLPQNQQMASSRQQRAEEICALEERIAQGDPEALATIGRKLLRSQSAKAQGVALLEKAAIQGDAQIQYELGNIYLSGRNGTPGIWKRAANGGLGPWRNSMSKPWKRLHRPTRTAGSDIRSTF